MTDRGQSADAYIAVGSNIDPEPNIAAALDLLAERVRVTGISTFHATPALGRADQPDYLNGVWVIRTDIPPRRLKFSMLRKIEDRLGRVRSDDKFAPRTIDLDIILYGDLVLDEPGLKIPSDDIARPFVATPLAELSPNLLLPGGGMPVSSLLGPTPDPTLRPRPEFTELLRKRLT